MMKYNDSAVIKAVAICFKPYLKPEEAMVYCNLGRTQLTKNVKSTGFLRITMGTTKRKISILFFLVRLRNMKRR